MRCRTVRGSLSPWLDGRLPAEARAALEGHLATCPACATEARALRRTDDLVRAALPAATPGADFFTSLERRIAREGDQRPVETASAIVRVRAFVPMAAALVLGAATAFFGMRLAGPGTAPAPAEPSPDRAADAAVRNMVTASDLVLTNLQHFPARDPRQALEIARAEADAVDLDRVLAQARTMLPVLQAQDRVYARQVESAVDGTECVSRGLREPGEPRLVLTSVRNEVERRGLPRLVRALVPGGVPRPLAGRNVRAERVADRPDDAWGNGVRCYMVGDLHHAATNFRVVIGAQGDEPLAARARFWLSRVQFLDGRPLDALRDIYPLLQEHGAVLREELLGQLVDVEVDIGELAAAAPPPRGRPGVVVQEFPVGRVQIHVGGKMLQAGEIPEGLVRLLGSKWVPTFDSIVGLEVDGTAVPAGRLPAELAQAVLAISPRLVELERFRVRPGGAEGEIAVELLLADVFFREPPGRNLARLIGEARGAPIAAEDGQSLVKRVVVRGRPAARLPRSPAPPAPPEPSNPPLPPAARG